MLAKLEFGMMMRDQTSPVKKADPHNQAKFEFCKEISKQTKLAKPMLDLETSNLEELKLLQTAMSLEQVKAVA